MSRNEISRHIPVPVPASRYGRRDILDTGRIENRLEFPLSMVRRLAVDGRSGRYVLKNAHIFGKEHLITEDYADRGDVTIEVVTLEGTDVVTEIANELPQKLMDSGMEFVLYSVDDIE